MVKFIGFMNRYMIGGKHNYGGQKAFTLIEVMVSAAVFVVVVSMGAVLFIT
ncbi:prepilin-type N-terminal cleavage/methylation domain-containing protein, partial [Patescibacteria group bacterium]